MIKKEIPGIFCFLLLITAVYANCTPAMVYAPCRESGIYLPATDTIYQTDTVYQYVIVYDTLYYDDSPQESDTTTITDTIVEQTDTAVIIRNNLKLNVKQKKTVYLNQDLKFIGNPEREFEEIPGPEKNKKNAPLTPVEKSGQRSKKRNQEKEVPDETKKLISLEPITYLLRDTLFFYDTIITREMLFDTVFFTNSSHADTTITKYTEFEKMGKLVMAIETVKFTVSRKESIFMEKNTRADYKPPSNNPVDQPNKKSRTTIRHQSSANNRWRRESRYAAREFSEKNFDYSTQVNGSLTVIKPEIFFKHNDIESEEYAKYLNDNTNSGNSFGASLSYTYFRDRYGWETGVGFAKHKYSIDHSYTATQIDSTLLWEYFETSVYEYDTTWYMNFDHFLETGEIVLIPHVDSLLVQVTDSIRKADYDTSYISKRAKYNYSYSFLEIPVIGRLKLFDGKVSGQLAIGVIPSFLISKNGMLPDKETSTPVKASEMKYDVGFCLSGYGAISLLYRFNTKCSFFVEPYYMHNLYSSMKNNDFKVKTHSFGARFGLSYMLFSSKNNKIR